MMKLDLKQECTSPDLGTMGHWTLWCRLTCFRVGSLGSWLRTRVFLLSLGVLSCGVLVAAACSPGVSSIDRTQPNALDKRLFDGIWYHRATITSSDPESGHLTGTASNLEKLRFEIREGLLTGYRSYEFVPYAEGLTDEGRDFFGAPVVAFKIEKHFDIQRDYSRTTGVENNVIVENDTDRPWHLRRYMRVDWSQNVVGTPTRFQTGWTSFPDGFLSGQSLSRFYIQGHVETDPDRPIFTEDYFDVTNVYHITPDPYYCSMMLLFNDVPRCGAGDVRVRLSFSKIDPNDDYQPLHYPDSKEIKDEEGNALIFGEGGKPCTESRVTTSPSKAEDPGSCRVETFPYDAAFGNFRTLRVAFDKERLLTRTGRIYMAGRFDLWEDSYDELTETYRDYEERRAKPIVYYGNVDFPQELIPAAKKIADAWNHPLAETVAFLQNKCVSDEGQSIPCTGSCGDQRCTTIGRPDVAGLETEMGAQMFQFRQNDCNIKNIRDYVKAQGHEAIVERIVGGMDLVARGNVRRVCAAVQFWELNNGKTLDPKRAAQEGLPMAFHWQRLGDLRYNFQNYVDPIQPRGPWGIAQFGQDPETGEFVSNVANYFGDAGDAISQRHVDVIQWLNGDLDEEELFRGDVSRRTVVSRLVHEGTSIRSEVRGSLMAYERDLVADLGADLLSPTRAGDEEQRVRQLLEGSTLEEDFLPTGDIFRGFRGPELYQPFSALPTPGQTAFQQDASLFPPGSGGSTVRSLASPLSWGMSAESNPFMEAAYEFGRLGFDMADFFDPNSSGLAESFQGASREEIFQFLRSELYAAVQGHEVGHTLGLRHNFEASMDPLNYRKEFWSHETDEGERQYWREAPSEEDRHRGNEFKYASLMDYAFDIPLEGLHGIGPYDGAAIRFMYGELIDVWNPRKVSIPDPRKFGDYSRLCGTRSGSFGQSSRFPFLGELRFLMGPEALPKLFSSSPVPRNETLCRLGPDGLADTEDDFDYEQNPACDTKFDTVMRQYVTRIEANSQSEGVPGCFLSINDQSWLLDQVDGFRTEPAAFLGNPQDGKGHRNISEARMMIPVADFVAQELEVLRNRPEADNPDTAVDESVDGVDDDGDGVADDRGLDWSRYMHRVEYAYCSDLYAGFVNPFCQRWDSGWDFLEATRNHINRYDRDYVFDHFRRDAYPIGGWYSPRAYMARFQSRRLFHMSNVFRFFLFTRTRRLDAPVYESWAEAAYEGLNFMERVIQAPEPGAYCLDAVKNLYTLWDGESSCEERFDVGLGFGAGRFLDTSWTNEYFYKANRLGAFYDKLAVIHQMTTSSGIFVRDLSDFFDIRAFSLGYPRVYLDPMLQRFAALIEGNHEGYRSRVLTDAASGQKRVRYMPFFDEEQQYGSCNTADECTLYPGSVCRGVGPGGNRRCVVRAVRRSIEDLPGIEPAWSYSLRFYALLYGLAHWSSINDYAPEFHRFTQISIRGTPEDIRYPDGLPIVEFRDPETFIVYRAPVIPPEPREGLGQEFRVYYGDTFHRASGRFRNWSVGSNLLSDADRFLKEEWERSLGACGDPEASGLVGPGLRFASREDACDAHERDRETLRSKVGFINIVRKFNRQVERVD